MARQAQDARQMAERSAKVERWRGSRTEFLTGSGVGPSSSGGVGHSSSVGPRKLFRRQSWSKVTDDKELAQKILSFAAPYLAPIAPVDRDDMLQRRAASFEMKTRPQNTSSAKAEDALRSPAAQSAAEDTAAANAASSAGPARSAPPVDRGGTVMRRRAASFEVRRRPQLLLWSEDKPPLEEEVANATSSAKGAGPTATAASPLPDDEPTNATSPSAMAAPDTFATSPATVAIDFAAPPASPSIEVLSSASSMAVASEPPNQKPVPLPHKERSGTPAVTQHSSVFLGSSSLGDVVGTGTGGDGGTASRVDGGEGFKDFSVNGCGSLILTGITVALVLLLIAYLIITPLSPGGVTLLAVLLPGTSQPLPPALPPLPPSPPPPTPPPLPQLPPSPRLPPLPPQPSSSPSPPPTLPSILDPTTSMHSHVRPPPSGRQPPSTWRARTPALTPPPLRADKGWRPQPLPVAAVPVEALLAVIVLLSVALILLLIRLSQLAKLAKQQQQQQRRQPRDTRGGWQPLHDDDDVEDAAGGCSGEHGIAQAVTVAATTAAADANVESGGRGTASPEMRAALQALEHQRLLTQEMTEQHRASEARYAAVVAELEAVRATPWRTEISARKPKSPPGAAAAGACASNSTNALDGSDSPDEIAAAEFSVGGAHLEPAHLEEAQVLLGMLIEERLLLQEARDEFLDASAATRDDLDIDSSAYEHFGSNGVLDGTDKECEPGSPGSTGSRLPEDGGLEDEQRAHALLDELVQRTERVHELQDALVSRLATPPRQAPTDTLGELFGDSSDISGSAAASHVPPFRCATLKASERGAIFASWQSSQDVEGLNEAYSPLASHLSLDERVERQQRMAMQKEEQSGGIGVVY